MPKNLHTCFKFIIYSRILRVFMDSFSKSFIYTFTCQSNTAYTVNSDKESVYSIVVACRSEYNLTKIYKFTNKFSKSTYR